MTDGLRRSDDGATPKDRLAQGVLRRTGIEAIGEVPWGTHFCQFYKTKQDLIDLLVPYFKEGLEQNEFCMWVTSEPLTEVEAKNALRRSVPDVDRYLAKGQLEIIPYTDWYRKDGTFDADRVLDGWVDKLAQARAKGFEGLRLSGNTFWLETQEWPAFTDYEQKVNSVIGQFRMMALCTYSLDKCGASEVIDVVSNHQFALIKRQQRWMRFESAEQRRTEGALRQLTGELEARVQAATAALNRVIHDRGERVKELTCLYKGARLLQDRTKPSADLLQELVVLLPPAWQYPEITAARILLDGMTVATPNFAETPWKQSAAFETADGRRGMIEVVYLEEKPDEAEGPFLAEERNLINALAESLVSYRERTQTEEALRASEETFRAMTTSAQDAVILLDHEGKISFWNQAAERIFGYPAHEVLGRELHGVCVPERFQEASRMGWSRFLRTGQGPVVGKTLELVARRRDGSEFPIELSVAAVQLGGRWNAVGILRDITERRQAQEAVIKEKGFTEATLNSLPGVFYLLDEQAGFLRWNQPFETVSGYSAQEFGRLRAMDLFGGADKTRVAEKIQEVFAKGRTTVEAQLMSKDGRQTPFLFTGVQLTLENRRYLVGMGIDITERKAAERKLLQQQIEQQALLDLIPAMVWYKDTQNRFLRVNRAAAEAAHRRIEDIEGKSAHEIYPEEADGYYRDDLEVIASGQPKLGIIELLQAGSGDKRWIQTDKVPYRDAEGRIVGVLVFAQDITEQKQAEEEHSRLAAIVASSSDAIIGKTLDGIVTSWNQGATHLYGYRADDILGHPITLLFPPDRLGEERRIMDQIMRGERVQPYETVRLRKDGSPIEVSVTTSPIRDAAGLIIGASTIARDVTERRKQEQEQRRLASFPALNPTLIVEVDAAGAVTYANPSALKPHPDLATLGAAHPVLHGAVELLARLKQEAGGTEIREIQAESRVYMQYCTPVEDYTRLRLYSMDITERKRAEEVLRQSEARFKTIFEQAPLGMALIDSLTGHIYAVNARFAQIAGRTVEDMTRIDWMSITHPDDVQKDLDQMALLNAGTIAGFQMEKRYLLPAGGVVWINMTIAPVTVEDTAHPRHLCMIEDITERKRTEQALRQQTRLLELFFRYTQTSIVFLDRDFNFLRVNDAYAKACGRAVSDFPGHNHFEFYPSDTQQIFEQVRETKTPYEALARPFVFPDHPEWGVTYWDWTLAPVLGESGEIEIFVFSLDDVTDRKQAEDALRKASIYNRSLIEASLDPLVTIGPNGTITDVNAATEAATGYSRQELIGTDFARYFTDPERARAGYGQVFREGLVRDYELEIRHREGTTRAVLYNASLYRDESGQVIGVFAAARDITERKQMERHAQRIEQLASMGQLLGGVVHELKNPLFIVTGRLQLLKEKLANREYDGLEPDLHKIGDAAQRMGLIAQRFLTLARPVQPALQRCSVAEIMKGVLDFLANELMKARITVVTEYAAGLPPCLSDPAQLHQAFLNLVMNALQAMAKAHGQGTLRVSAALVTDRGTRGRGDTEQERHGDTEIAASPRLPVSASAAEGGWIEVRIQDDGPGIPPEHRARLFEPFFTTKPIGEGTGLGLWTVQMIVAGLKGTVSCETEVGRGTTFIVRLPATEELNH